MSDNGSYGVHRFWAQTRADGDCLLWEGATNPHPVYGVYNAFGGRLVAHRVSYELSVGPIPPHSHVGRVCRQPLCIAPDHLFLQDPSKSLDPAADWRKKLASCTSTLANGCVVMRAPGVRVRALERAVYERQHGPLPRNKQVVRSCGTDGCLNSDHLLVAPRPCRPYVKMPPYSVRTMRSMAQSGEHGLADLARRFGVSRQTARTVVYNLSRIDPDYQPPEWLPRHRASRAACRQGHALEGDNVVVLGNGGRRCRQCRDAARRPRKGLEQRFWEKVDRSGDCWLWNAYRHDGWGYFSVNRSPRLAHRVAYELDHGPIPDGVKVLHSCPNHHCVRGDHLYLSPGAAP